MRQTADPFGKRCGLRCQRCATDRIDPFHAKALSFMISVTCPRPNQPGSQARPSEKTILRTRTHTHKYVHVSLYCALYKNTHLIKKNSILSVKCFCARHAHTFHISSVKELKVRRTTRRSDPEDGPPGGPQRGRHSQRRGYLPETARSGRSTRATPPAKDFHLVRE